MSSKGFQLFLGLPVDADSLVSASPAILIKDRKIVVLL
jgi:hypothetical protein